MGGKGGLPLLIGTKLCRPSSYSQCVPLPQEEASLKVVSLSLVSLQERQASNFAEPCCYAHKQSFSSIIVFILVIIIAIIFIIIIVVVIIIIIVGCMMSVGVNAGLW